MPLPLDREQPPALPVPMLRPAHSPRPPPSLPLLPLRWRCAPSPHRLTEA